MTKFRVRNPQGSNPKAFLDAKGRTLQLLPGETVDCDLTDSQMRTMTDWLGTRQVQPVESAPRRGRPPKSEARTDG